MAELKHAVYCGTRNVYDDIETAAKSLVANTSVDVVHFLIEDAEFPRELPSIIRVHDVSGQEFFDPDGPNAKTGWTWMVLMRAALCHVMRDVDKVLSLDCDTICHGDADAVWELPLDGCYFAGVTEQHKSRDGLQYANMGVVLFNLEKLRDGKADECIAVINSRGYTWPEQDVMNYLCQGRICEMPKRFNDMDFNGPTAGAVITHYAAKPRGEWSKLPEPMQYAAMTWDQVLKMREYRNCSTVLFASNHGLERDESIRAVWDKYEGPKELVRPVERIANVSGYPVVITDTLTPYIPDKRFKLVNIGHGITGGKKYALDEKRAGIDPRAMAQTDYAISTSTKTAGIVAGQFGIPQERVLPLGFPRADWYIGKKKGDGGTFMANYARAYLYAPTFRGPNDGESLPRIDWEKLDGMLEEGEVVVVKRHYFQREPIVTADVDRVVEVPACEGIAPYLIDCDVLLTDFSSTLFDAHILEKPVVLTTDDQEAYTSTRGMYYEFPSFYSPRSLKAEGDEEGLLAMLREAAQDGMTETERNCRETVADMCDGHAAERVCELLRDLAK